MAVAVASPIRICFAERADIKKILALEGMQNESILQLSEKELLASLQEAQICLLAEDTRTRSVDAYLLYGWSNVLKGDLHEGDLHISRFVVHPDERYGLAEKTLIHEVKKRVVKSRGMATYFCRERDLGQQVLLNAAGFRAISVIRGFFLDTCEDAYLFEFNGR